MAVVNQVLQGDCLEVLKTLPDNCVDLICTDPPYFKVKKEWWDRQWSKPECFLNWLDSIAEQWQRILKPNGSLYCFASPKMAARVEVTMGERFNVLTHIVWQKDTEYPPGDGRMSYIKKIVKEELRTHLTTTERIIFCEQYGADNIAKGEAGYGAKCDELRGFVFEPLRQYIVGEFKKSGLDKIQLNVICGFSATQGGMASRHYLSASQWCLPTEEHYLKLRQATGCFLRPYEELRQQYEELRRPFTVTADVPYTDVWTFPTVSAYPGKHPCEKPAAMLEHIINVSSRQGDTVLDCFAGSGSTLSAAKKLGRNYIGIEIDPHWVNFAKQRLGDFSQRQPTLEERVQWLETQVQAQSSQIKRLEQRQQLSLFG